MVEADQNIPRNWLFESFPDFIKLTVSFYEIGKGFKVTRFRQTVNSGPKPRVYITMMVFKSRAKKIVTLEL